MEKEQQGVQQTQAIDAQDSECDDPHERVRAPMVEVESYPGFLEAITSLKSDFFKSPIPEEERKEIIYECPRFLVMKYTTPPLNETATPVIWKSNVALPIDDYVHKKLKYLATGIKDNNDLEFDHLMQKLLYDVASNITQTRIETFHKSMELPGRVPKLADLTLKPLVKNENLDKLLASKKIPTNNAQWLSVKPREFFPVGKQLFMFCAGWARLTDNKWIRNIVEKGLKIPLRNLNPKKPKASMRKNFKISRGISAKQLILKILKSFLEEKQNVIRTQENNTGISYGPLLTPSSASLQAKDKKGGQQHNIQGGCGSPRKEGNQTGKEFNTRILQSTFYYTKEDRRLAPCLRSQETQQLRRAEEF
ncbi:hypothetical protein BB561_006054 [Smittium simulii]|uniref:Uncharacterized protein n=1 Tax=Smittium simulii TaxID=133385 RepID=A0A2T9Y6T9_9FUNG|nr:hypothetical protein BB561_006054 [Smittium simulii]